MLFTNNNMNTNNSSIIKKKIMFFQRGSMVLERKKTKNFGTVLLAPLAPWEQITCPTTPNCLSTQRCLAGHCIGVESRQTAVIECSEWCSKALV